MTGQPFARALLLFAWLSSLLLNGCGPKSPAPALSAQSQRFVFTPSAIAALSAHEPNSGLPSEVQLGGAFGHSALFLRFPDAWRGRGVPLRAFLVLSPSPYAPAVAEPVRVQVWRASSAWAASELHEWSDQPTLAPPYASAEVTNAPPAELRIDVSEWLRFARNHPERDFGLALISQASSGGGLSVATGSSGGRAPRLEVYVP